MLLTACPKYYLLLRPFLFPLCYLVNHICKFLISVFLCLQTIIFVPDRQLTVVTISEKIELSPRKFYKTESCFQNLHAVGGFTKMPVDLTLHFIEIFSPLKRIATSFRVFQNFVLTFCRRKLTIFFNQIQISETLLT